MKNLKRKKCKVFIKKKHHKISHYTEKIEKNEIWNEIEQKAAF